MAWRILSWIGACGLLVAACGAPFEPVGSGGSGPGGSGGGGATSASSGSGGTGGATASSSSGGPSTPIVIVQATPTVLDGFSDVPEITLTTPPTAGNAVIVAMTCFSDIDYCTIPEGGVTDNQGNTYTRVKEGESIVSTITHGARGYIFIAENIGAPSGPFVIRADPNGSIPPNVQNLAWGALEVSGLAASSIDQTGGTPNECCPDSTTVSTLGPTSQANELAIAVFTNRSNDDDIQCAPQDGWTQHHINQNGQSLATAHSMVSKILSSAEIASHTWTHEPSTRGASAIIATFRGVSPN
jgi:hypothetical protein